MKLIQQIKLFYKEGNSDKVYEIDLCNIDTTNYVVNFRYGRRGSLLKEGTKTPEYVSLEKAQIIFAKLENEKTSKGYASEIETLIDLPSLNSIEPDSINGVILQRLEDAVIGKQTFKTQWKTSRVIWKAGLLEIQEAIPYIIKLASKGDELQTYSALWALIKLKSTLAQGVFKSYALQTKQKEYLRNLAHEGLLEILKEEELQNHLAILLETIPPEVKYHIDKKDYDALIQLLKEELESNSIKYLTALYLLAKFDNQLHEIVVFLLEAVPFRPPYFKHIRAIYKLAVLRNDIEVVAVLAYRFENENPMYTRTVSLESEYNDSQFISTINERVNVGKELRGKDSKIAFSNFTKSYFQKNALRFLKELDSELDSKKYLKFAVSILLKYTENNYTKAEKLPLNYAEYNYNDKKYYHTIIDYPECANLLLLSTILFGNDTNRILNSKLQFILGKEIVSSNSYYYSANQVSKATNIKKSNQEETSPNSIINIAKKAFSTFFGKKEIHKKPEPTLVLEPKAVLENHTNRLELFPEHWDAFPEAYIQLLMEAQMNVIHEFAYTNLKARNDFETLTNRFDSISILKLLNNNFIIPNQLGFETIVLKNETLSTQISFVADVLSSKTASARNWAKNLITADNETFLNDIDCIVKLVFNDVPDLKNWISEILASFSFTEDKSKVITGKVILELLTFEESVDNNNWAILAVERLEQIATPQLEQLSWDIVARLISSDLKTNNLLASSILILKSKNTDSTEIPISLIVLFLEDETIEIRQNGKQLLNNYPDKFLINNIDVIRTLIHSQYLDVVETVLECITRLSNLQANTIVVSLRDSCYAMIHKENFEGAHLAFKKFILEKSNRQWDTSFEPRDVIKLIHANYRESQLTGYEILKNYSRKDDFTIRQIISLGNHEILAIRQWCWNYFMDKKERIRSERNNALGILDTTWDDTRTFAFHFFKTEFDETDWDLDCLISITDSVLPAVEQFGKEIITQYFNPNDGAIYLTKLSQHPSVNIQFFVTNYLNTYATNNLDKLEELSFYFRSVLTRVHKARVAKQRVFQFLQQEGKKSEAAAILVTAIIDEVSATAAIQDKANCIAILTDLKKLYPQLHTHLIFKN
jgi:predicted DNA-binding WGR domain protein